MTKQQPEVTTPPAANTPLGTPPIEPPPVWKRAGYTPIELRETTKPNTISIPFGVKWIHFITNETATFTDLLDQVKRTAPPEEIVYIDRHFNAGGGSGFLVLSNERGVSFGLLLNDEYEKIYQEKGWAFYPDENQIRVTDDFAVLRLATPRGIAAIVDEFGFIDDPINGEEIRAFIASKPGQIEIAAATLRAIVNTNFKHIVMGAGHHGDRGTVGATANGVHETVYAFETFEAMSKLIEDGFESPANPVKPSIFHIQPQKAKKSKACRM